MREATRGEAISRAAETPHILLNAPLVGQRLGYPEISGLDLLELFAFIHPARFAVPTPAGLSRALGLEPPASEADAAEALRRIAGTLLGQLGDPDWIEREGAWTTNATLQRLGWGWAGPVAARVVATVEVLVRTVDHAHRAPAAEAGVGEVGVDVEHGVGVHRQVVGGDASGDRGEEGVGGGIGTAEPWRGGFRRLLRYGLHGLISVSGVVDGRTGGPRPNKHGRVAYTEPFELESSLRSSKPLICCSASSFVMP